MMDGPISSSTMSMRLREGMVREHPSPHDIPHAPSPQCFQYIVNFLSLSLCQSKLNFVRTWVRIGLTMFVAITIDIRGEAGLETHV